MNIIGKIIGIIAFVLIILMVLNYKTLLPFFDNLVLGGGAKSPFQIGTSYVEQIEAIYPYEEYGGSLGTVKYGSFVASNTRAKTGKITVEKSGNALYMTTENAPVPPQNSKAHVWLTNTPTITDDTRYIDFGVVHENSMWRYSVMLKDSNLSLDEYKHVMIVDTETYTIYHQSILGK